KLVELIRADIVKEFYWTKEWRTIRKISRRLDNNEFQRCVRAGRYTPANMVHQKKEVKNHPELALELDNTECI
ncbi:HNH endonuclease, partial [Streptococcus suis]